MEFQKLGDLAADGRYGSLDAFEETPSLKLATAVVDRNETFSDMMHRFGHTFQYSNDNDGAIVAADGTPDYSNDGESEESDGDGGDHYAVRFVDDHPELDDMFLAQTTISDPETDNILGWLKRMYQGSRGFELGTFDASLLAVTMRKQSSKWEALAKGYIEDVATMVHRFIRKTLDRICPDERVRESLVALLNDSLVELYMKASHHVSFILEVERAGIPVTVNHYFNDNLEKR